MGGCKSSSVGEAASSINLMKLVNPGNLMGNSAGVTMNH